jgi:hypothetical protein
MSSSDVAKRAQGSKLNKNSPITEAVRSGTVSTINKVFIHTSLRVRLKTDVRVASV